MPRPRKDALSGGRAIELRQKMTEAEIKLWAELRSHRFEGIHFRRQHPVGKYIVDFCSPEHKLIIELDGGQHLKQAGHDAVRTAYLESLGFRVLRFWNDAVLQDMQAVLSVIYEEVKESLNE